MDITNPNFRAAAKRVIVALIDHVKDHPSVTGYQLDNGTKPYETSGSQRAAGLRRVDANSLSRPRRIE
jgi:beta-galactosidase